MKTPNDRKRPNTQGSVEDKIRKLTVKYFFVSKPLIKIPIWDAEGKDTGLRRTVAVFKGSTYRRGIKVWSSI